ncbi:MAG: hypothetical protein LCH44_12475 [Bacteroidetes bacterium]|nr:hypothetical protein [Bacteroidota bacterium]
MMKNIKEKGILLSFSVFMIVIWGMLQFDIGNVTVSTKAFSIIFTILLSIWISEVQYFSDLNSRVKLQWLLAGPIFYILLALMRLNFEFVGTLFMLSTVFVVAFILKKNVYRVSFILCSLPISLLFYYYF